MNADMGFEFFCAQYDELALIKKSYKIEIYNVFDKETETVRILKICKGRDLSSVCKSLVDIRHPNVAVVYDFVYHNGDTYILEEKLQGETLEEKLEKKGKLSPAETIRIAIKVCDGLSVLHAMKPPVIHNDIKPSNIFICDDGNIKIFDFDISRVYKTNASHNTEIMATEAYASPAHYGYGQTDQRSDVYSLGVVMHKMLTGQVLDKNKNSVYKGKLNSIITKCIEYDPKNTYKSANQLKKDLEKQQSHKKGKTVAVLFAFVLVIFGAGLFANKFINGNVAQLLGQNLSDSDVFEADKSDPITENAENTETTENEKNTTNRSEENNIKKLNVISRLSGELVSMLSLNDGTIVYIESIAKEFHIKTSTGIDNALTGSYDEYELLYNTYTDELYLFCDDSVDGYSNIYSLNESFVMEKEPVYKNYGAFYGEFYGFFLSDGTLYCNRFRESLIDSNQWIGIGSADFEVTTQFNDRMFCVKSYGITEEKGYGAESISYDIPWDRLNDGRYCATKQGLFIYATKDDKDYIYKFDGENFFPMVCLNDYKYYTPSAYTKFVIAEDVIWLYDKQANILKEISIK